MSVDHCRGTVKDDECYWLDTFMLGLTPSWSRASSTLVALPCFTAVLTIRIGRTISIGNRSINICRLQSCDHLSLAQASGFSSILRSKLQIKTEVSCSTHCHCHCHCPLDKVYILSFRTHLKTFSRFFQVDNIETERSRQDRYSNNN